MKTKLEMAHEWAMKHGNAETVGSRQNMVKYAWEYADAMQAEAEKRKPSGLPESLRERHDFTEAIAKGVENYEKEEWQPDWSQAPEWANWWVATANQSGKITGGWFYNAKPGFGFGVGPSVYYSMNGNNNGISAASFGYTGDWRNSLRKRPE